jgi:hypothetical protein
MARRRGERGLARFAKVDLHAGNGNVVFKTLQNKFAGIVFDHNRVKLEPAEWEAQTTNFALNRGGFVKIERN